MENQVTRDEKGRVVKGSVLNPGGLPKDVRELHALVRTGIPRAFERALDFLESDDPQTVKIGMDWIGKYGLPVPVMKGADKASDTGTAGISASELRELLAALRRAH